MHIVCQIKYFKTNILNLTNKSVKVSEVIFISIEDN